MTGDRLRSSLSGIAVALIVGASGGCHRADGEPVAAAPGVAVVPGQAARFVKFEELTEWTGKPWATVAEFDLMDSTGAIVDRSQWTIAADSAGDNDKAALAIDGDPKTHWHSRWEGPEPAPAPPHWIVFGLGVPVRVTGFRYLPRQDGVANGAIAKYRLYLSDDGIHWGEPVASGDFATMGAATSEKVVVFAAQTENHPPVAKSPTVADVAMGQPMTVAIEASDSDGDRLLYTATGLPPGLAIAKTTGVIAGTPIAPGSYTIDVQVSDGKAPPTAVRFPLVVQRPATSPLAAGEIRFAKLEELSEVDGKPWATVAEFNLIGEDGSNLPRAGWIASADSADTSDQPRNAIDENPGTVWHSQWSGEARPPPHALIVDLGHGARVKGFRYLPRQDGLPNGTIARFRFYTSVDGTAWGSPVAEGDFSTMGSLAAEKTVSIK